MPWRVIFQADQDVHSDGPHENAVRLRKWVYAASFTAIAFQSGWFGVSEVARALGIAGIPSYVAQTAFSVSAFYFYSQFALVFVQLVNLYPKILRTRVNAKTIEEFRKVFAQRQEVRAEASRRYRENQKELLELEETLRRQKENAESSPNTSAELGLIMHQIMSLKEQMREENETAKAELDLSRKDFARGLGVATKPRKILFISEVVLDGVRFLPPLIAGAITITNLNLTHAILHYLISLPSTVLSFFGS